MAIFTISKIKNFPINIEINKIFFAILIFTNFAKYYFTYYIVYMLVFNSSSRFVTL